MTKKNYFICFCILLLFAKCSDDSTNPNETQRINPIIGEWKYNTSSMNNTRIFNSDGTFTDSITLKNSTYIPDQTKAVIKGKYNLVDSILTFSDFHMETVTSFWGLSIGYRLLDCIVTFNNGTMTLKSFVVLDGNGNNDGIQGRWETNNWYCKYVKQYVADYQYGNLKEVYIFSSSDNSVIDSSYFHNLPNDSTYIDYYNVETYHYYAPYLLMVDTIRVEFKNNLMYWYYVNNDQIYEKVN